MSTKTKQWGAIIVMIALFAMIAFVTNLCSPMAVIVKKPIRCQQFPVTDWQLRQLYRLSRHGHSLRYAHQTVWL